MCQELAYTENSVFARVGAAFVRRLGYASWHHSPKAIAATPFNYITLLLGVQHMDRPRDYILTTHQRRSTSNHVT